MVKKSKNLKIETDLVIIYVLFYETMFWLYFSQTNLLD